jgi:serine/threonine protein kinase
MVVQQSQYRLLGWGEIDLSESNEKSSRQEIFMVFPYMDHDLCGLLGNQDFKMSHSLAKLFMKQILEGMAYIHSVSPRLLCSS